MTHPQPPAAPPDPRPHAASRFTRVLFAAGLVLGTLTVGARLVRGYRTGDVQWIELAAPLAIVLGLTGVMIGPRRPYLYYPVLLASAVLLLLFYASPHQVPR